MCVQLRSNICLANIVFQMKSVFSFYLKLCKTYCRPCESKAQVIQQKIEMCVNQYDGKILTTVRQKKT